MIIICFLFKELQVAGKLRAARRLRMGETLNLE